MKRTAYVVVLVILAAFLATAALASSDTWKIDIAASAPSPIITGTLTFGASTSAIDGKDGSDANIPPAPEPKLVMLVSHPDMPASARDFRQDMRAPWTSGTKIWSNIVLKSYGIPLDNPVTVTVAWTKGTGTLEPPAGTYKLQDLDNGVEYDLGTNGNFTLNIPDDKGTGTLGNYRIIATIGTGLLPSKIVKIGAAGKRVVASPSMDEAGNTYAAADDGKIYKVAPDGTAAALATIGGTNEATSVKGRIAQYGGNLYAVAARVASGVTYARLGAVKLDGTSVFAPIDIPGTTSVSAPAVDPATGNIYVGTDTAIVRLAANGTGAVSNTLGGSPAGVYSPAISGSTDQIWATAGNGKIYRLNNDLSTILTQTAIGTPMASAPSVQPLNGTMTVIAAGAKTLASFNASTGAAGATYTASDFIGCTPYFTPAGNMAFFTTADGKVHGVNLATMASLPNFPVALPANWLEVPYFQPNPANNTMSYLDASPVYTDGKLFVAAGRAGTGHFIIDVATGAVKMGSGSDAAGSSPVLSPDKKKVAFGSRDGNLYVYDTGL